MCAKGLGRKGEQRNPLGFFEKARISSIREKDRENQRIEEARVS